MPGHVLAGHVVDADDVGLRTHRGWVFRGFELRAERGQLIAIAGPGGSGRSSLLLTLGGRMRSTDGRLRVCGQPLPGQAARVRRLTAVARIGGAAEPEEGLRVADHVRERAMAAKTSPHAFAAACDAIGAKPPSGDLIGSLGPHEVTALALALGLMDGRPVVLLDDLDAGVDGDGQAWLWATARRAAATGACVLATTTEGGYAEPHAHQVLSL